MTNKGIHYTNFVKDAELMEKAMCKVSSSPDIWQNQIIYALCKAVYHILMWAIRKEIGT